jgi:hypothetical protein
MPQSWYKSPRKGLFTGSLKIPMCEQINLQPMPGENQWRRKPRRRKHDAASEHWRLQIRAAKTMDPTIFAKH